MISHSSRQIFSALPNDFTSRGASLDLGAENLPRQQSIAFFKKRVASLREYAHLNSIRLNETMANMNSTIVAGSTGRDIKQVEEESPVRRCLALIAHNNMKPAMQEFVIEHKEILQHFRLTGTNSTMTMLREIFKGMDVEYGPTMSSGPLGGDAQVAALLTRGDLGGMIFFQDPLNAHPHIADVHSLLRLANVHDILYACNRTSARAMMWTLKAGLEDPSIIPSFYETLESPSVQKYREEQKALVEMLKERQLEIETAKSQALTQIKSLSTFLSTEEETAEEEVEAKELAVGGEALTPELDSFPECLSPLDHISISFTADSSREAIADKAVFPSADSPAVGANGK